MVKLWIFIFLILAQFMMVQIEYGSVAIAQDDYEVDYEGDTGGDFEEPIEKPTPGPSKKNAGKGKGANSGPETAQGVRAKNRFSAPVQSDTKSVYKKNGVRLDVDTD